MIEAGVISEAILPSSASFPFPSHAVIVHAPRQTQDTNPLPGGAATGVDIDAQLPSTDLVMSAKNDIPQKDGSGDGDDADIKPNTNAPYDEDDEDLNENDDVKKKKGTNKWDCKFKAGVMQINDKDFFFSEAKGDFNF
ncbi:transcription initiation factor IIA subunit 1 [Brassica napus]|uniref:transcription initiation factor IIA subunit 1 n=1 Tax=Brassica napus TaxID=3708 RepID=UPI002078AE75|nr:transcription initiation factor IIA subunit 1 [Brassica napus]